MMWQHYKYSFSIMVIVLLCVLSSYAREKELSNNQLFTLSPGIEPTDFVSIGLGYEHMKINTFSFPHHGMLPNYTTSNEYQYLLSAQLGYYHKSFVPEPRFLFGNIAIASYMTYGVEIEAAITNMRVETSGTIQSLNANNHMVMSPYRRETSIKEYWCSVEPKVSYTLFNEYSGLKCTFGAIVLIPIRGRYSDILRLVDSVGTNTLPYENGDIQYSSDRRVISIDNQSWSMPVGYGVNIAVSKDFSIYNHYYIQGFPGRQSIFLSPTLSFEYLWKSHIVKESITGIIGLKLNVQLILPLAAFINGTSKQDTYPVYEGEMGYSTSTIDN